MRRRVKVISGGQIGADMAALRAAKSCGLPTGGVAPAELVLKHNLGFYGVTVFPPSSRPMPLAERLVKRSMHNVDTSQATIAFRFGPSVGTDKTIGYATSKQWRSAVVESPGGNFEMATKYKPVFVVVNMDNAERCADEIVNFIKKINVWVINVCGPREWPVIENYEKRVEEVLKLAFSSCV